MTGPLALQAEAIIDMANAETPEDRRLREATEIYNMANDHSIPIMTAIRQIAERMEGVRK